MGGRLSVCVQSLQGVSFHRRLAQPDHFHRLTSDMPSDSRHAPSRSIPSLGSDLKRKESDGLFGRAKQVVLAERASGLGFPMSRVPDNQHYSVFKLPNISFRL